MSTMRAMDLLTRLEREKKVRVNRTIGDVEFVLRAGKVTVLAFPGGGELPSRTLSRPMPRSTRDLLHLADEVLTPTTG